MMIALGMYDLAKGSLAIAVTVIILIASLTYAHSYTRTRQGKIVPSSVTCSDVRIASAQNPGYADMPYEQLRTIAEQLGYSFSLQQYQAARRCFRWHRGGEQ